jgi:predicted nucleotidyltransferase
MKRPKYRIIQIEDLKNFIGDLLKNYEEIQIVYLYGSYAKGNQIEFSDIDIGIITKENFQESPLYFPELSSAIEKKFNYKINVDLRRLNNAKPRFLFQVLNNSIILFVKNRRFLHEFELKVLSMYQENKPMLEMYDKIYIMEVLNDK